VVCLRLIISIGVRHACDQGDGLDGYTWTEYDAEEGGVQVIKDGQNNVKITTEFLKVPGGMHGGSWAARIKGQPIDPSMFYFLKEVNLTHRPCIYEISLRKCLLYFTLGWRVWAEWTWIPTSTTMYAFYSLRLEIST
jgi:hypothetical protein